MKNGKLKITEWFDTDNLEHLKAFNNLIKKCYWPKDFLPKDIIMDDGWESLLQYRMAKKWIESKIENKEFE